MLLFERKLWIAMDDSVLHIAGSTEEALEVLRPASKDGCIVGEQVLSIKTAYGIVDLMRVSMHCLRTSERSP